MFTDDDVVLSAIERNDWLNKMSLKEREATDLLKEKNLGEDQRPPTASRKFDENEFKNLNELLKAEANFSKDGRPLTSAKWSK
jgi:hypothetical protein